MEMVDLLELRSEKRWLGLFFLLVTLWLVSLTSTLYQWIAGINPLTGNNINLFYITLPLLVIIFFYTFVSFFVFCFYLVTFNRVRNYQLRKILASKEGEGKLIDIGNSAPVPSFTDDLCSIIIPASNEENVIRKTVSHCLLQTHHNIEVIVICHNCYDGTFSEAQVQDNRVRAFELRTNEAGKGIALNEGVKRARGKYVLILDSDGFLSRDFIEKAIPLFDERRKVSAVQGRYVPSNRDHSLITKLLALEGDLWSTPLMTFGSLVGKEVILGGTGYIIRKDVLNEMGNFTNHLVDDFELTCRLLEKKHKTVFAPLSINYDEKPPTFDILLRQRARWGKGFLSLMKTRTLGPRNVLANIQRLSPLATLSGFLMLLIIGFDAIFNMVFGYYLYSYAYVPLQLWFVLVGSLICVQSMVLVKQYGSKGLKYSAYLLIYNLFTNYNLEASIKAFFVKSWNSTKTTHGFITDSMRQKVEAQVRT
jgi:cellulose synthase/poly-beta-1,6-N-acetylglucosamine synthase-like glycosyltransferase